MTSVDVLLCTFRRPEVTETLASLGRLEVPTDVALRVVVADNDDTPTAQSRVEAAAETLPFAVDYIHAPARNISIARNAGLSASRAEWVAFIDDDEVADPAWLQSLLTSAEKTGADAVFGPALAAYGDAAPDWMRDQDHHSNIPERRAGRVETGHTCNALLRWGQAPWVDQRFDVSRGRSGGEDTEFFFRLHRMGARFEISDDAIVREPVAANRLTFKWLSRRKYRMGQSYAARAVSRSQRLKLAATAFCKAVFCGAATLIYSFSSGRRHFWALRCALHVGVISGCLSMKPPELYGGSAS